MKKLFTGKKALSFLLISVLLLSSCALAACSHLYGDWFIKEEATDCSTGIKAARCTKCGALTYEKYYPEGTLWNGIQGYDDEVLAVNRALIALGYPGNEEPYFSTTTVSSIRAFQKDMGFEVTGIAYPQTLNALIGGAIGIDVCSYDGDAYIACTRHEELLEQVGTLTERSQYVAACTLLISAIELEFAEIFASADPVLISAGTPAYAAYKVAASGLTAYDINAYCVYLEHLAAVCSVTAGTYNEQPKG